MSSLTVLDVLEWTDAIVVPDEGHWTKGAYARRLDEGVCSVEDFDAYKFCYLGAIHRATWDISGQPSSDQDRFSCWNLLNAATSAIVKELPVFSVFSMTAINDHRGYAAVKEHLAHVTSKQR